jgi:hypothetical protein
MNENIRARTSLVKSLDRQRAIITAKIDRLERYPILGEPCSASDSNKVVWSCWCAECKEIVTSIVNHDALPEWLR